MAKLRAQCAEYVRSHSDDFLPFSTDPKTGDLFTNGEERKRQLMMCILYRQLSGLLLVFIDEFAQYCSDIENTVAWGGQLEVSVLNI